MNRLLAALLVACAPALALAQAPPKPKAPPKAAPKAAVKPAARPAARPAPRKPSPETLKAIEESVPLEEPDPAIKLSDADLEVATKVYVGDIPCELGATVHIRPLRRTGFFLVRVKATRFVMHPVESRTGAVRLEDPVQGAMWLQLGNKSMLMSQKLGQRLADECQSADQKTAAEALKKNPINLLEPPPAPPPAEIVAPAAVPDPQAPAASEPASAAEAPRPASN